MLKRGDVERRLAGWFVDRLQIEVPASDTDLLETGVLDSLGFVELLLHLEREFGVTVALERLELHHFRSIERIAAFLLDGSGLPSRTGSRVSREA